MDYLKDTKRKSQPRLAELLCGKVVKPETLFNASNYKANNTSQQLFSRWTDNVPHTYISLHRLRLGFRCSPATNRTTMKITIAILLSLSAIRLTNGLCNTCSATTGLACVAEDKFEVCVDGIPTPPAIQCPDGTICTPSAQVCSASEDAPASCRRCNKCSDSKVFACTDYSTFALCFGTDTPNEMEYHCPFDLVCNVDSINICVDRRLTGIGATCPETWTTTAEPEMIAYTTPRPEEQPNAYCEAKGFPGRFEIISDVNCQSYISCMFMGQAWVGNLYECPKGTFFNPVTQMCGPVRPNRCS